MSNFLNLPKHIAIIMDGNGRWGTRKGCSRTLGHEEGAIRVQELVDEVLTLKIPYLSLFSFGQANWYRPAQEISSLLKIFLKQLDNMEQLRTKGVKVRFLGNWHEKEQLPLDLYHRLIQVQEDNFSAAASLNLDIFFDYSGSSDIIQACNTLRQKDLEITQENLTDHLLSYPHPFPDLLIRTGGECRLSNFMIWQLANTEIYFTPTLWPDFKVKDFTKALSWYATRQRRFGKTPEQVKHDLTVETKQC